jgi:hypothetical protein
MGMQPPEMAKIETILFRRIRKFHDYFVERLAVGAKDTLRCTAWQLDAYIEENKKYKDIDYLRTLLQTLEWVIQKKFSTAWSVERAKIDMRGRTRGVNQHSWGRPEIQKKVPMPKGLRQEIEKRISMAKPVS